jgi:L-iditol 2-dehydrogenase
MRRARLISAERVVLEEFDPEEPREDEVRLEVEFCGICGSDVHAYFNKHPFIKLPRVPGHECSAVIEKLGASVVGLQVGQRVTLIPQLACGKCHNCRNGRYNICENLRVIGAQVDGAMSELFNVDSSLVIPIPDEISLEEAALIEPLAVAVRAVKAAGGLLGKKVVVLGSGAIGLFIAQVSKAAGASAVVSTDVSEFRLKLAKELGADVVVNARETPITRDALSSLVPEGRIDVAFEAVGIESTIRQAIESVAKGGTVIVVGVFGDETRVNMGLIQDREIRVQGSLMYLREDFQDAISLMSRKLVKVRPLITHISDLDHVEDAFRTATLKERAVKVLVRI